jgi:nitrate reductase gamma subunit
MDDGWLGIATGPLFAATFLVMVLGLARHVLLQLCLVATKAATLRRVRWRQAVADSLGWVVPVRHLVPGTLILSLTSILFHVGAILVPIFLPDHVALWEGFLGVGLPSIGRSLADALTLVTIGCLAVLFGYRLLIPRSRALSRTSDYVILLLIAAPFVSGYLAAHPGLNPLPWRSMMLVHVLGAEALLVAVPFTKLAHVVLFFFDRLSLIHWQLRPGAGDRVAEALCGKEARV